jgi:uncharacterized protein YecT (DUF1311 family)
MPSGPSTPDLEAVERRTCADAQTREGCPGESTVAQFCCAEVRYATATAEMNRALEQLIDTLGHQYAVILQADAQDAQAEQARVRAAQGAWERFRDATCETTLASGFGPEGTMYPVGVLECEVRMTQQRTEQLKRDAAQMPIPPFPDGQP